MLSDYEAVEVLWVGLVKAANLVPGKSEHQRMFSLVQKMPTAGIEALLRHDAVDKLLKLDPPLETVLVDPHERLYAKETTVAMETIKRGCMNAPREALLALGEVLKRIRNKRAHGFKTRKGERDAVILAAARALLLALCQLAVEALTEQGRVRR